MRQSKLFTAVITIALLGAMVVGCGGPKSVTFPDENLEAAIRDALGKPVGEEITSEELAGITTLEANDSDIVDLSGLEYCTNLNELLLLLNQISDISPLSNLNNLTRLILSFNQISDISPLSKLTNLPELSLMYNQISNISPLSNLTNLPELSLMYNQISNISPLSNLTSLTGLALDRNQISDISPLVENSGLGAGDEVWLEDNNLDLTEGSEDMENIRILEERGVVVHYKEPSPTESETGTGIFLDENLEAAIRAALGKPEGEKIIAAELANLTMLKVESSGITDLSGLEYCTNLIRLILTGNQISDISPLSNLTSLTDLVLYKNQISDISPLSSLTNLTLLFLSWEQISDLSPLASLTNLTHLYLGGNQISDISPLASLTNLLERYLDGNQISDITPLVENSGLGAGDEVWLEDNNLDLGEGSDDMENIRALEERGVVVHY